MNISQAWFEYNDLNIHTPVNGKIVCTTQLIVKLFNILTYYTYTTKSKLRLLLQF